MNSHRSLRSLKSVTPRSLLVAAVLAGWILQGNAHADGIVDDAFSSATTGADSPTLTFSHTVGAGTNQYLIVAVAFDLNNNGTVSGVTYNGVAMTFLVERIRLPSVATSIWGLASPATGANNVVITMDDGAAPPNPTNAQMVGTALSFLNVSGTAGSTATNFGVGTALSKAVSTPLSPNSNVGAYVVDSIAFNSNPGDTTTAVAAGQTGRSDANATSALLIDVHGATSTQPAPVCTINAAPPGSGCTPTATTTTMAWTLGASKNWAHAMVVLNKAVNAAVQFGAMDAAHDGNRVHIGWRTGFEVDNLGFILYREMNGEKVRITPSVIPGSALTTGQGISLVAGRAYGWTDQPPAGGHDLRYWLEEIDLSGQRTMRGPVTPARSLSQATIPELLGPGATRGKPRALRDQQEIRASDSPVSPSIQRAQGASAARVKMIINKEGWYRVSQAQLLAAGLDPNADPRRLRLTREGKDVGLLVTGEADGRLDSSDAVEFFATGADLPWTNEGVYWLDADSSGRRIALTVSPVIGAAEASTFSTSAEARDRNTYFGALLNGEKENFFGPMIRSTQIEVPVKLEGLDPTAPAELEVSVQGVSLTSHHIQINLNGAPLQLDFDGRNASLVKAGINPARLVEGDNKVVIRAIGGDQDVSALDYVRINYGRRYEAANGKLRFTATGGKRVTLGGFATGIARIFDVTDPSVVTELTTETDGQGASRTVKVAVPGSGQRTLLAVSEDQIGAPVAIRGDNPSSWAGGSAGADLLIISHRDFMGSLGPLRAQRESEGLTVAVADIEDVYDEYSYGQKSPYALRAFIESARTKWQHVPRFVLLVGDSSFDARNYLGKGSFDFVPTKFVDVELLETSSDDWFVTPPGKSSPDVAVGRLPVRTAGEASAVIAKIVGFKQGQGRNHDFFLYADQTGEADFETPVRQLASDMGDRLHMKALFRGEMAAGTRAKVLEALNAGPLIAGYLGHGSEDLWAGNVLTSSDAAQLTNRDHPSLYLPMTCLNNYFQDVYQTGLGKALLLNPGGGALAVFASSALVDSGRQVLLNRAFLSAMAHGSRTLGEAIMVAKDKVRNQPLNQSWILLGDPSTQLPAIELLAPADASGQAKDSSGGGCSCSVGGRSANSGALAGALFLLFAVFVARRRARR